MVLAYLIRFLTVNEYFWHFNRSFVPAYTWRWYVISIWAQNYKGNKGVLRCILHHLKRLFWIGHARPFCRAEHVLHTNDDDEINALHYKIFHKICTTRFVSCAYYIHLLYFFAIILTTQRIYSLMNTLCFLANMQRLCIYYSI